MRPGSCLQSMGLIVLPASSRRMPLAPTFEALPLSRAPRRTLARSSPSLTKRTAHRNLASELATPVKQPSRAAGPSARHADTLYARRALVLFPTEPWRHMKLSRNLAASISLYVMARPSRVTTGACLLRQSRPLPSLPQSSRLDTADPIPAHISNAPKDMFTSQKSTADSRSQPWRPSSSLEPLGNPQLP